MREAEGDVPRGLVGLGLPFPVWARLGPTGVVASGWGRFPGLDMSLASSSSHLAGRLVSVGGLRLERMSRVAWPNWDVVT